MSTFPRSEFYDLGELLTQLGIGEAALTILSENGVLTPVVHTRLRAPSSRMGPADDVDAAAKASPLFAKYGKRVDAQSAREMLAARMQAASAPTAVPVLRRPVRGAKRLGQGSGQGAAQRGGDAPEAGAMGQGAEALGKFLKSRQGRQLEKQVARGLFGLLKKKL